MVDCRAAQVLALSRFTDEQVAAMTRACLRDPAVPAEVLGPVTDRADGLPFFVEELLTVWCATAPSPGASVRRLEVRR